MTALASLDRSVLREELERLDADGWLLFDFHGCNPVAQRLLPGGMATREKSGDSQNSASAAARWTRRSGRS